MKKRLISLILSILLLGTLLIGCAADDRQSGDSVPEGEVDLTFFFYDSYQRGEQTENIEAKVRELVMQELGIVIDVQWISPMEWQNRVQQAISSEEPLDVFCLTPGYGVSDLAPSGMLMDISTYLPTYAPQTCEIMSEYLATHSFDGGLYGVPSVGNYCQDYYLLLSGKVLDAYGLRKQAENCTSFSELEELFTAVQQQPENTAWAFGAKEGLWFNGFLAGADSFSEHVAYDDLADPLKLVFCADGVVSSVVDHAQYQASCARMARWQEQGWIWPDSATTVENHQNLVQREVLLCTTSAAAPGLEISSAGNPEVVAIKMADGLVTSADASHWGVGVASTSEDPVNACRFIELLYTNAELLMTLVRGLAHEDYLPNGDTIVPLNTYLQNDNVIGNNVLLKPVSSAGSDHYKKVAQTNAAAAKSDCLGFTLDTSDLIQEMTRLSSVTARYHGLLIGGGYTDELYAEYRQALTEAGLDEYLSAIQTRLDAWLAQ